MFNRPSFLILWLSSSSRVPSNSMETRRNYCQEGGLLVTLVTSQTLTLKTQMIQLPHLIQTVFRSVASVKLESWLLTIVNSTYILCRRYCKVSSRSRQTLPTMDFRHTTRSNLIWLSVVARLSTTSSWWIYECQSWTGSPPPRKFFLITMRWVNRTLSSTWYKTLRFLQSPPTSILTLRIGPKRSGWQECIKNLFRLTRCGRFSKEV